MSANLPGVADRTYAKPAVPVAPDSQWQNLYGTNDDLRVLADSWPLHGETSPAVVSMLETCRTSSFTDTSCMSSSRSQLRGASSR